MSIIQASANNNGGGATTVVVTISASGAGNQLVGLLGPRSTVTLSSVTDNKGNTWVVPAPSNPDFIGTNIPAAAYCLNPIAGTTTITFNMSGSAAAGAFVQERNDVGSFIGAIIGDNGSVAVTAWTSHGVVCSGATIGLGLTSTGTTGIVYTAGSGWASLSGTNITLGSNTNVPDGDQIYAESQSFGSGGTYDANGTNAPTTTQNSLGIFFNVATSDTLMGQACY